MKELKRHFDNLSLLHHPDKNPEDVEKANAIMAEINLEREQAKLRCQQSTLVPDGKGDHVSEESEEDVRAPAPDSDDDSGPSPKKHTTDDRHGNPVPLHQEPPKPSTRPIRRYMYSWEPLKPDEEYDDPTMKPTMSNPGSRSKAAARAKYRKTQSVGVDHRGALQALYERKDVKHMKMLCRHIRTMSQEGNVRLAQLMSDSREIGKRQGVAEFELVKAALESARVCRLAWLKELNSLANEARHEQKGDGERAEVPTSLS